MTGRLRKPSEKDLFITVSGSHGSGRSTQAKRLADEFGLRYVSSGVLFRKMAEERNVTLEELSKQAQEDPDLDRRIDERAVEESKNRGIVLDATLSGWMAEAADLKIFLTAPLEERITRIAKREGVTFEEAEAETLSREKSERERFNKYYGIDVDDLSIYDLVLNTGPFDLYGVARILKKLVDEYCSGS